MLVRWKSVSKSSQEDQKRPKFSKVLPLIMVCDGEMMYPVFQSMALLVDPSSALDACMLRQNFGKF